MNNSTQSNIDTEKDKTSNIEENKNINKMNENWTQRYVDYDKEEPEPRDISNDYIKEEMVGNVRGVFIKTRNLELDELQNTNENESNLNKNESEINKNESEINKNEINKNEMDKNEINKNDREINESNKNKPDMDINKIDLLNQSRKVLFKEPTSSNLDENIKKNENIDNRTENMNKSDTINRTGNITMTDNTNKISGNMLNNENNRRSVPGSSNFEELPPREK
jgi:hypothetical protein